MSEIPTITGQCYTVPCAGDIADFMIKGCANEITLMNIPEAPDFLFLVDLKRAADTSVWQGEGEFSWDEFKDRLSTHDFRNAKDGAGFMPVLMKPEQDCKLIYPTNKASKPHHRGDVNIEAITSLVIDLDQPGALEKAESVFSGYEYLVYSTHNYTKDQPWKFRMVVRLLEPILVDNWPLCFEALKDCIKLDPSCCNPSRFYYYPSHNKNSEIDPVTFHKRGSPISLDQILSLAGDKEALLKDRPIKYRLSERAKPVQMINHFSGKTVSRYDAVSDEIDMSWAAMSERHKFSIDTYRLAGSNHNLALSITAREITKMGPKVDLRSTLIFAFQVASAEGERGLESGNTMDELPGMIIDGMLKYAPEAYDKFEKEHGVGLENWLHGLVRLASICYTTENLPSQPSEKTTMGNYDRDLKARQNDTKTEYEVLKERHKPFLRDFIKTGDIKALVKLVLDHELKAAQPKYPEIAKALVNYQIGYQSAVLHKPSLDGWAVVQQDLESLKRLFSDKHLNADPQKITFARSAFLIESMTRIPQEVVPKSPTP